MWRRIARWFSRDGSGRESGQGTHEYAGLLVLVAVVMVGIAVLTMSGTLNAMWRASACAIDSQATCSGGYVQPSPTPTDQP